MIRPKYPTFKDADFKLYETPWKGWVFKDGHLWDDAGNFYTQRDVVESWIAGKIIDGRLGKASNIRILKDHLKEQTIRVKALPRIVLEWEDDTGISKEVYKLQRGHNA